MLLRASASDMGFCMDSSVITCFSFSHELLYELTHTPVFLFIFRPLPTLLGIQKRKEVQSFIINNGRKRLFIVTSIDRYTYLFYIHPRTIFAFLHVVLWKQLVNSLSIKASFSDLSPAIILAVILSLATVHWEVPLG